MARTGNCNTPSTPDTSVTHRGFRWNSLNFQPALGLHVDAARSAVKFDPMLYLHNIKALWNAGRSYVPRNVVRLRKLGNAGLSALWADKFLSPLAADDPQNMRRELAFSITERRHNQTDLPTALDAVQDSRPAELG